MILMATKKMNYSNIMKKKDIDNETAWTKEYTYCREEVPP
jgi:hypothetical protein